jgi:hypothetical protein
MWLLSRMCPRVASQGAVLRERPAARLTYSLERNVAPHVGTSEVPEPDDR